MSVVIGVDVGGTKATAGPVDRRGSIVDEPLHEPTVLTSADECIAGLVATLRRALHRFAGLGPVAVGVACAGTVDEAGRMVVTSPNLPLERAPLAGLLSEALGLEVVLENDVNAALRAEAAVGAAKGLRQVVMVTLGTGVGGGLLLDGRLYRGIGGGAGELGHTIVCGGGEPCGCGAEGCLEMYASGRALARFAGQRAGSPTDDPDGTLARLREDEALDGRMVGRLVAQGYPGALAAAQELSLWLGRGLVSITNTFNPQMIVVGGGVADLGEVILGPARDYVLRVAMAPNREQAKVVRALLGNRAGLVGGGLAAWEVRNAADARVHGTHDGLAGR